MGVEKTIGLIGARGYVGREILRLIAQHPNLTLAYASSRDLAGQPVSVLAPAAGALVIEELTPQDAAERHADIVILGLPNGLAAPYVKAFEDTSPETLIIDLSADYRFDADWAYGLPELYGQREDLQQAKRISNPGCYATAGQLAVYPVLPLLSQAPSIFAVSGFSGAGTKPSPMNDPARLENNLVPYKLIGHIHEKEMSRHLGREIYFSPHVHPAFSGILATVHLQFSTPITQEELYHLYKNQYKDDMLIEVQQETPELKQGTDMEGARLGGFSVSEDGLHGVVVCIEDNLQKGAAVQAMQNINIASGFDMLMGIKSN